ncbi:beta-alanine-activating enzyme isoform X1 [Gadus macrocephalus]|uniref:beta-alanine-activating enzyme isoform X1 n=2 Tax=Gadus macrocephalus TaxID=80720 RepID=UPI0028CB18EF|nr:beta-alanine-activating enzyme isoform X1 [Gadus macrocephalus]XP_059923033.1 beta-alanine-activating enzyme isoform X1 [Gadus macrocephalus]
MNGNKLQDALIAAALKHADRVAVTFDMGSGPENCVSLSYKDVVGHGNELSSSLRNVCRENNGLIGLYVQNDLYLPVWIFGILQLPAAYVPLNPDVPGILSARIMSMCDLNYCTLQSSLFEHFQKKFSKLITVEVCAVWPDYNLTLVRVQPLSSAVILDLGTQQEGTWRACEGWPHASTYLADYTKKGDFAYVLHTSGTTGLPKIVRVPHKCIVPNIQHLRSLFQIGAEDLVFLASPLTFDPSVVEIFLALSSGARLLIAPSVIKKAPNRLAKLLFKDHKTTVLQVTPTLLGRFGHRTLTEEVLSAGSSLRVLALGGEACPSLGLLRSWRQEGNRTQMYNVYGITEVSCWASCHQVPESLLKSSHQAASSIPIGAPLLNTSVEVRDDWGCVITAGQGQLFIGGQERVCLIDDESTMVPGTMRATGDWVEMEGKHLHYLGRRDRLVKRNGQRVNLDTVQQVMMSLPQVESCAVGLFKDLRLVAFVVASPSVHQVAATPLQAELSLSVPGDHEGDRGFLADLPEDGSRSEAPIRVLHRVVLQQLSLLVPSASIPDSLVLVQALPLTAHGKVDMNALMKLYQQQREHLESVNSFENMAKLKQRLICLWQDSLGLPEDAVVEDDSLFLFSGGDSLKALRLCDNIIATVGLGVPGLLEAILEGSFTEVVCLIARATRLSPAADNIPNAPSARKRSADHPASSTMVKREHTETYSAPHHLHGPVGSTDGRLTKVLRRAGQVLEMNVSNPETLSGSHCKTISANIKNDYSAKDTSETGIQRALVPELEPRSPELRVRWSSDMGRCVDASPLLVVVQDREAGGTGSKKATVFIGSHSHRMQALDLTTGGLLWERVLGDRIESSAVVMRCGTQLAVGCYDGAVYFLCVASGASRWVFETGDAVKSSPAVDPATGLVIVGSHDGHLYALDPQAQKCVWKYHCGGGAVFSSPYLEPTRRRLYAASLRGHFVCLYPDSGEVMWTYNRETPFFSSPSGSPGCVVIGSVDGNICFFSDTGQLLWQFLAKGAVFSTPCFTPDRQRVLCGAHDGYVYCLETAGGSLVWSFQTSGRVYASPFAFESRSALGREQVLVGVASTDGMLWILDERDGCKIASLSLPGELFSSPVVWERTLLVGCRNDMVYCVDLTNPPNKEELEGHAHMETLPGTGDA